MNTKYRLCVTGYPELETELSEKDDAIAEAHRIADTYSANVAVIEVRQSMLAFLRPAPASRHIANITKRAVHREPATAAEAVRAAFVEGMQTGFASRDLHNMTAEEAIDFRWRESDAFDYWQALKELE